MVCPSQDAASASQQHTGSSQVSSDAPLGSPSPPRPFLPLLVSLLQLLRPLISPPSTVSSSATSSPAPPFSPAAISSYAARCVHACVGLLMNLTHQHKEGVAAAVEAGVLPALVELLTCACCAHAPQQGGPGTRREGDDDGQGSLLRSGDLLHQQEPLLPCRLGRGYRAIIWRVIYLHGLSDDLDYSRVPLSCRSEILGHLDLVTVCFGLLINLTSLFPENRDRLRALSTGHTFVVSGAAEAAKKGEVERRSSGVVALLCSIFDVISEEVKEERQVPDGTGTGANRQSPSRDEGDVTADELHEGHQDGEAAIVQVGNVFF